MAWSPFQRSNAGIVWVEQPGDYANPIPTTSATGPISFDETSVRNGGVTRWTERRQKAEARIFISNLRWSADKFVEIPAIAGGVATGAAIANITY